VRARFHPHRLWISPDAKKGAPRLLFVSDTITQTVNIYSMPDLTIKGQVAGFIDPRGECADRSGNIWVADAGAGEITKLSRTGDVDRHIHDPLGYPWGCAVDPTTGNLAVTNLFGATAEGNVTIYPNASPPGMELTNPDMYYYSFAGYDTSGNLWIDGLNDAGKAILSFCGASSCSTIPLTGGTIYAPGFIQWAVRWRSWYVADRQCGNAVRFCIYPVSGSGVLGTPITLTDPQGHTVCNMNQGVITNSKSKVYVGGVDDSQCGRINSVARWRFPRGGPSTHDTTDIAFPWGAAISQK
jgi:hypothetical protein